MTIQVEMETVPYRGGSARVKAVFTDFDGNPFSPVSVYYTLKDGAGENVVNEIEAVNGLSSVVEDSDETYLLLELTGDDLEYLTGEENQAERQLTIYGTFLSADTGSTMDFKKILKFYIDED